MIFKSIKYLSITFAAVCFAASCTSEVSDPDPVSSNTAMVFDISSTTRANHTTKYNITDNSIDVYGDMRFLNGSSSEATTIMKGMELKYDSSIDAWTYSGTHYWYPNHEHSFVAIHPYQLIEALNPVFSNSNLSFTYTIPTTPTGNGNIIDKDDVDDIIVATHRRRYDSSNSTVALNFQHLFTQINISPAMKNTMPEDCYVEFKKLSFTGIKNKAEFNIRPSTLQSNNQTDDMVIEALNDGNTMMTVEFTSPKKIMNNGVYIPLFEDNDAIIMLPQTFDENSKSEIILYYSVNGEDEIKSLKLTLKEKEWQAGKSIMYKFIYQGETVTIEPPTIIDWTTNSSDAEAKSD